MAKNSRSIALDRAIEEELKAMLAQGIAEAPISATTLHERLIVKGVVKGGVSTLSKPDRIEMIKRYKSNQATASGVDKSKYTYGSLGYYKERNQKIYTELSKRKAQLSYNTQVLVAIINRVESQTVVKVEDLLAPYLAHDDFDPFEDISF